jgi:drug/metabolite transporter (DMT)-like permease
MTLSSDYTFVLLALGSAATASIGQMLLKIGMSSRSVPESLIALLLHIVRTPTVVVGLACYAVSTLLWLAALSRVELGRLYPFTALTFLVVMLLSRFVLREHFDIYKVAGVAMVLAGLFLLVRGMQ